MGSHVFKIIPREQIAGEFPYRVRYSLADLALEKSVRSHGILNPLIVTAGRKNILVAGHKRFAAAQAAGIGQIPVLKIQNAPLLKELFLLAVLSNWRQTGSELDCAWAVRLAVETYGMSEAELLEEVLPALFLSPEKGFIEESLAVSHLESSLLDLIAARKLPFRGAKVLSRFTKEDQKSFAQLAASGFMFTTNQLMRAGEWIYDLLKSKQESLSSLLKTKELQAVLERPHADSRQKAEQFCLLLRRLRYPQLTQKEEKFAAFSNDFQRSNGEVRLEAPESFEAEGFSLRARIRDRESLNRVLDLLARKKTLLNSLFDIML